jgi:hypothetical protein
VENPLTKNTPLGALWNAPIVVDWSKNHTNVKLLAKINSKIMPKNPSKRPKTAPGGAITIKLIDQDLCTVAQALKRNLELNYLQLGESLKIIHENDSWQGKYEDYADFIENGLKMNQGTASKLVKIFETFVEKYAFPREKLIETSWTNLYTVIPLIQDKDDAEEWIDKASTLTRTDLGREIEERKTGKEMKECDHEWEIITMRRCRNCHIKQTNFND